MMQSEAGSFNFGNYIAVGDLNDDQIDDVLVSDMDEVLVGIEDPYGTPLSMVFRGKRASVPNLIRPIESEMN